VALREGHRKYFLSEPNDARLGVAWAHIALENGRGKETYNNNFGNLGATDAFEGKYYIRYLRERVQRNPDVWKYLRIKFRSYDTPADGARAYWKVLQDHYGTSLGYMDAGQPFEAAKRLNTGGYATALTEPYVMGVVQLYGEYNSRIGPALASGAKE
jgi:flagellum-specific peptidoglycan hydrolase FlgJ